MSNTLRETILAAVKTALEAITAGATYSTTVEHVYFPPSASPRGQCTINMRDMGDTTAQLSRLAYEHLMTLELECRVHEADSATRRAKTEQLVGDVVKAIEANDNWSSYAIASHSAVSRRVYGEEATDVAHAFVELQIIFRVKSTDPYTIRNIGN